jgi:hypothetical protein
MQPPFPLDAPLFTVAELKQISRLPSGTVDVYLHRRIIQPTRSPAKSKRGSRGRHLFSTIAISKARFLAELWSHLFVRGTEILDVANDPIFEFAMIFDENWMWAVARSVERETPLKIHCYAVFIDGSWKIDPQVGEELKEPCFGLKVPHIFIPMSEIFASVYLECKAIQT